VSVGTRGFVSSKGLNLVSSIAENVTATRAAKELMDLGLDLARETGLSVEQVRRYWSSVAEMAAQIVGDDLLCARCKAGMLRELTPDGRWRKSEDRGKRLTDDDRMPWGKYKDERLGDIPDSYFKWLLRQEWIDDFEDLKEYAEVVEG